MCKPKRWPISMRPAGVKGTNEETIASLPGFGMAPVGHLSYSADLTMRARRPQPCLVRVRIDPIPAKG